jgi:hypothetical protein
MLLMLCTTASAQTAQQIPTPPRPPLSTYQNVADAKAHCGTDPVVWANSASHVTHTDHSRWYGKTKQGFYVCQSAAANAGYRAAKD